MRAVRRASRAIALVLSLVLANLSLAGSAYACTMGSESTMDAMVSMSGMAMAGAQSTPVNQSAQQMSDQRQQRENPPCGLPTPGACQLMAPCAPVALISIDNRATASATPNVRVADFTTPLLPSATRAPEVPPPRA
ncbi:MAG: hypothetical protein ABI026_11340 [Gemmatimonadaceae bacterium]